MAKKLFVGNLSHSLSNDDLQNLFATHGEVISAHVIIDRETGRSKGFGFVEMSNQDEAQEAIDSLNGKEVNGRAIVVNEARPQAERPNRGGFGGSRGGGGPHRGHGGGGGGGYKGSGSGNRGNFRGGSRREG